MGGPGWDPPLRPPWARLDQTDDSCPGPDPISVLGEAPCALRQGSHELPLTLLRLQGEDSPALTSAQVPTRAHMYTCTAARGAPGRTGISSMWDQGSPWGLHTREAGPRPPSFLGWDLPGLIPLVRAAAGPEPHPSPQARLWSPGRRPPPGMWSIWAFWLLRLRTNGHVHQLPGGKGQRTLDAPGRDVGGFGPHSPLPEMAGTPQPW